MNDLPTEPLTQEQENALAKAKTEDARNTLVLHSMREAMAYAYRCSRGMLERDELFSLCYDALQRAAKRFSPNRIRFFAYAKQDVRRGITIAWREKDVVKNSSMHEDKDREPDYRHEGDGPESSAEYNENLEGTHSIDRVPLSTTDDFDRIREEQTVEPEFEKIHVKERMALIKPIMEKKLTDVEKMVIDLYFNGDMTFQQIGDMLNVSRAWAQMVHFEGLKKIRCELLRRKALFNY